jgi:hypothetical protein
MSSPRTCGFRSSASTGCFSTSIFHSCSTRPGWSATCIDGWVAHRLDRAVGQITDAFCAAVHRFARDNAIPWVDFVKGQRKDDVMHEHGHQARRDVAAFHDPASVRIAVAGSGRRTTRFLPCADARTGVRAGAIAPVSGIRAWTARVCTYNRHGGARTLSLLFR